MKQHAGIDVQAMYPAETRLGPGADQWNWETFLTGGGEVQRGGLPLRPARPAPSRDAVDWVGAMFRCYGAEMVDARGNITIRNNDKVRQVMDYAARLFQHIPSEMFAADDATNNRALIAGRTALIFNPPSAWAVAKRDAPAGGGAGLALPEPRRARPATSCRTCPTSTASGASAATSPRRRRCWSTCRNASRWQKLVAASERLRHPALRHHDRQSTPGRDGRAAARDGVQLPGPPAPQGASRTSPAPRRRPRSRCRCTTRASRRR